MGNAITAAVAAESCCGVNVLNENIFPFDDTLCSTNVSNNKMQYDCYVCSSTGIEALLHVKFVTYTFYCSDTIEVKLLPYFTDMYIDGTVTYDHFGAPYLV